MTLEQYSEDKQCTLCVILGGGNHVIHSIILRPFLSRLSMIVFSTDDDQLRCLTTAVSDQNGIIDRFMLPSRT